jgi:DNA polymerase-3 subunit delta
VTAEQFLAQVQKGQIGSAYLFLGPESYDRDRCRRALLAKFLGDDREYGYVRHDLNETSLPEVLDDACSFSLFSPRRVIWVSRAEEAGGEAGLEMLGRYLKDPPPGVAMVFDSSKYEFEGEDKNKTEKVRKTFAGVRDQVEFPRWKMEQARRLAQELARESGLRIGDSELNYLVEAVAASPARVSVEMEKLRLYVGSGGEVSMDHILKLVPQAQATTIFALVAALGRNDRKKALELLDSLLREGEYLPLALGFLEAQLRQAMAAREAGLKNAYQVQGHFAKMGVPMWPSKAEQILQTVSALSNAKIGKAIERTAKADAALRDIRPDDRVVLEEFIVNLAK